MNDQIGPGSLLDTTDSLEAVGVFRGWKNFMFLVVLLSLLLVQVAFWLVNTGTVPLEPRPADEVPVAAPAPAAVEANAPADANALADANAPADPNAAAAAAGRSGTFEDMLPVEITFENLSLALDIVNAVLILSAGLYFLSIMFSLKVSLTGKLGGINHISRAFFLAMIMFVLLLPWQRVFGGLVVGAIFTAAELKVAFCAERSELFEMTTYYLRFCGYWLLMLLLLLLAQMRTCRWTRAILRRLEVV